jgi:wobble nucleotide-excising tRNase
MTRITRISRLHDCGIFRDFAWSAELPDFGRYNLIYGWNGTGKTTLSRILRCLEKRTVPASQARVALDGQDLPGDEFPNAAVPIRVFNREFIAENVFPVGGGDLPPIFVLGAASIEKQKEVEQLKGKRATAQSKLDSALASKQQAGRNFDRFCSDRARIIKETLRSGGQNPYNNYNKASFHDDALKMAAAGNGDNHRLSEAEREKLLTQHRAVPKPKVQEVTYALPDFDAILGNLSQLLATTIVSAAIEALKGDPTLAEWTREGLGLHRARNAERCLFCEQGLPANRLAALEAHFSAEYEQFMQRLEQLIAELRAMSMTAAGLQLPNKAELYDDLAAEFETAEAGVNKVLEAVRSFVEAAVQALESKKHRAFEQVEARLQRPQLDAEAVKKLNAVIRKHNQACDEFQTRVDDARKRLALDMIATELRDFEGLRKEQQQAAADVWTFVQEVQRLDAEIARLEREIIEHRQPAEELNEDLRKYLGHDELCLEIKETGYTITRRGVPALALSEGEMTAIALLYFLKTLQDKRFDLADGVVVLDDPVSSLDANALYLAFGFIRERTQRAGQLIILTHNSTFFRQVRNWFHHLKGQNKNDVSQRPARFYMLDCAHDHNGRCATIRWLDPLLEQYDSEYHYLFARVYRASTGTWPTRLEENYVLPNMARRMLEAFLAFRQPQAAGELWQKVQAMPFDDAKKLRILRFLHTHSHSSAVGEPEHDPSVLAEAGSVLKDLLEFIEAQDNAHFDAMVKLVKPQAAEEDDR